MEDGEEGSAQADCGTWAGGRFLVLALRGLVPRHNHLCCLAYISRLPLFVVRAWQHNHLAQVCDTELQEHLRVCPGMQRAGVHRASEPSR